MNMVELLSTQNVAIRVTSTSKKSALESLCELALYGTAVITQKEALNALIEREKLGSTAIGHGVALPHTRLEGIDRPLGALILLAEPLHFDAPDDQPIDLLFGLLMPIDSTEEHLKILAEIAGRFSLKSYREQLRSAKSNEEFYRIATGKQL